MSDVIVATIPQWVIDLIKGIADRVDGARASYLSMILEQVTNTRMDINTLSIGLTQGIVGLNTNINNSRETLSKQITNTTSEINKHSDENTSSVLSAVKTGNTEIVKRLDSIDGALGNIGDKIGEAVSTALKGIVDSLGDLQEEILRGQKEAFASLELKISNAIESQGEMIRQALNSAAEQISIVNVTLQETKVMLKEEFEKLIATVSKSLDDHAKTLDKAIRESAGGITNAMLADTIAEAGYTATLAAAITAGCTEIAVAITGAQAANKLLTAGKIAKDIELADKIISLLAIVGEITAINSPEAVAEILTPIVNAYFNIGRSITEKAL